MSGELSLSKLMAPRQVSPAEVARLCREALAKVETFTTFPDELRWMTALNVRNMIENDGGPNLSVGRVRYALARMDDIQRGQRAGLVVYRVGVWS